MGPATAVLVNLQSRLRERDPGLLRFRQAAKSVLAVTLALLIFRRSSPVDSLFAAMSAAFLMQCTDTGSRRRQQVSMALTAAAILIFAPLGSALHGNRGAEAALLIFWAGAIYYARRFLRGAGAFTLYAFTEVVLATALPVGPKVQFLTAGAGFLIAFPFRFWFWPANEARAISDATHFFSARKTLVLEALSKADPAGAAGHVEALRETVLFNENLLTEHPELDREGVQRRLLRAQYEVLQSLRMMRQATIHKNAEVTPGSCTPVHQAVADLAHCRLVDIAAGSQADLAALDRNLP